MSSNFALNEAIVKTLSYFDLFDFPLTAEELFVFLWQPPAISYADFVAYLENTPTQLWESEQGLYFLPGRSANIVSRQRHVIPTELMLKKARHAMRFLAWIPFLKAVLVCNSVGTETATLESDVDLLIITAPKRMWLVRFLAHSILRLFGLRTYGNKTAGRMCLSFFADSDHLDFGSLRTRPDDIHFAYWLVQMFPVYDNADYAGQFQSANTWLTEFLPNYTTLFCFPFRTTHQAPIRKISHLIKNILEKMWGTSYGRILEAEACKVQQRSLSPRIQALAALPDTNVVIKDGILKLHEHDARQACYQQWQEKMKYVYSKDI